MNHELHTSPSHSDSSADSLAVAAVLRAGACAFVDCAVAVTVLSLSPSSLMCNGVNATH